MNIDDFEKNREDFLKPPGILGSDEMRQASVLIALVLVENEYHFLFEKRNEDIRQGGEVCFPGGLFDQNIDSSLQDTAIRETVEELGIPEDKIELKGRIDTLFAPQAGMIIESFIGILDIESIDELTLSSDEVSEVFLVPVSYFENNKPEIHKTRLVVEPYYFDKGGKKVTLLPVDDLKLPERYHKPWGKNLINVYFYNSKPEMVWGFTARLVLAFIKKLKRSGSSN
jgi:8-oxo-dGTP pyrophosphatase MutT (NUDIX family)